MFGLFQKTFKVEVHMRSGKTVTISVEKDEKTTPLAIRELAATTFKMGDDAGYFQLMGHVFCATQIEAISVYNS